MSLSIQKNNNIIKINLGFHFFFTLQLFAFDLIELSFIIIFFIKKFLQEG